MRKWIILSVVSLVSLPAIAQNDDQSALHAQHKIIQGMFDGNDPTRVHMLYASAAYEAHDIPKMILEADRTLALDRKYETLKSTERGFIYFVKGMAYLADRPKMALPFLTKAASLLRDSRTLYNLSCTQSILGMFPQAEISFREALESGARDGRFGDSKYYINSSLSDEQLAPLRARPTYRHILQTFGYK